MSDLMRFVSNALPPLGLLLLLAVCVAQAQVPQTLSYQGFLENAAGTPLNTTATLTFSLWTHPTSTNPNDQVWTETHPGVSITDGLYTVSLGSLTSFASQSVDFSAAYWLETAVDEGSGPVVLAPRTALQAVPYAFHAMNAGSAGSAWSLTGNGGTVPGTHFLGTTDAAALEVRVNNERALRIEPTAEFDASNMIGGHPGNAAPGMVGVTISGGGYVDEISAFQNVVTGDYGTVGGGRGNEAGEYGSVGGGQFNASSGPLSTVGGGHANTAAGYLATVDGGQSNEASGDYAAVGGGVYNAVTAPYGTIGGGGSPDPSRGNRVTDEGGTVAGGTSNQAGDDAGTTNDASYATVGGGQNNAVTALYGTIGGGGAPDPSYGNRVTDYYGTVAGGLNNQAGDDAGTTNSASYATVGGGLNNTASGVASTVGGGQSNEASGFGSAVSGGSDNTASPFGATVGGGIVNTASGDHSTVNGGGSNTANGSGSAVSGGYNNTASGYASTVGGGWYNTASGVASTVGGGQSNEASGDRATVGGGWSNTASAAYATIAGGGPSDVNFPFNTRNRVTDEYGTIGGGGNNQAGDAAGTTTDAPYATVSGGFSNTASGYIATVSGGDGNTANGYIATVSGGRTNTASGKYATVPGGLQNTASGEISFAAGRRAQATHNGSFVWGDYTDADIASTASNQFVARASGGTYFFSNSAATTGVVLNPGSGSWTSASSVHLKTDFEAIDPGVVLAKVASLPVQAWRYQAEADGIRHVGPTAEAFYATFGLGPTDAGITSVDADGIALAAIQALHALLVEKDARIEALQQQLDDLQAQVSLLFQERQP